VTLRPAPILLFCALAAGGCGGATTPSAPSATASTSAPRRHVRTLPKKVFVRRANTICSRFNRRADATGLDLRDIDTLASSVGRVHRLARTMRRQLARLGRPSRDQARWVRVMSKLQAVERHLDETRAALWSRSRPMTVLAARQTIAATESLQRRLRLFGMRRCAAA
jgi:hypothetical protein